MLQSGKARVRQRADIHAAVLGAAARHFAECGFDGASLRQIASDAGVLQPQINYHFGSKLSLWKEVVDSLMAELDVALAAILQTSANPRHLLAEAIEAIVRSSAARPELSRIILHESTAATPRLVWLIDAHIGPIDDALVVLWQELADWPGARSFPLAVTHHVLMSAALPYACSPENDLLAARRNRLGLSRLDGAAGDPVWLQGHIDALVTALLPPPTTVTAPIATPALAGQRRGVTPRVGRASER